MKVRIRPNNLGNYIVPNDTKNGVCLEIGGNVGSFTEKYKNHFSKIHYYEPLIECYELIQSKIDLPHVTGFNLAGYKTSNEELDMVLHANKDSGSTGLKTDSLNEDWSDKLYQKVTTISLEDMIYQLGVNEIDYCKSDCETGEYYLFLGKDLSKIKYIGLECHHQMGKTKWDELINYLTETHDLISNNKTHQKGKNKDLFFKRR